MYTLKNKNFITRKRALSILTSKGISSSLKKIETFEQNILFILNDNIFSHKVMSKFYPYDIKYLESNYINLYYFYTNNKFFQKISSDIKNNKLNFLNSSFYPEELSNFLSHMSLTFDEINFVQNLFLEHSLFLNSQFKEMDSNITMLINSKSTTSNIHIIFNKEIKSLNLKIDKLKDIEFDSTNTDFIFFLYFLIKFSVFVHTNFVKYETRILADINKTKLYIDKFSISNIVKNTCNNLTYPEIENTIRISQKHFKNYFEKLLIELPELNDMFISKENLKKAFVCITINNPRFNNFKNFITIIKNITSKNKQISDSEKSFILDNFNNEALLEYFSNNNELYKLRLDYELKLITYSKLKLIDIFNKL